MIYQLVVPGPIEDVTEIRVLEWSRAETNVVTAGDLLVELETDKAVVEVRAGGSGILRKIISPAGDWQKIGSPLALLSDTPDEPLPADEGVEAPPFPVEFEVL
jgi:pyruvate/2-oxoglutarate dehydrogenase complex dihydrolipoamide acyltransferase (E2) component